jgi:transmembrane sensor
MDASVTSPSNGHDDELLLGKAADWLVILTSGKATESDARELAGWREQDPAHEAAFRHVARLMNLTRVLIEHPPRRVDRRAVLAGGAAFMVGGIAYGLARPPLGLWPSYAELMADHRTGTGERYAFAPASGVEVEMNSRTSVSLMESGRGIELINGEAFVAARRPSEMFEVRSAALRTVAWNAAFNIQAIDGEVALVCVEGEVSCRSDRAQLVLRRGERLALGDDGQLGRSAVNARVATAWRDGLLVFEDTPLAEVVRQINRYRSGDIVLTNPAIGGRPVNAVLHTAQIDNAVSQIQQLLNLDARRLPGGVILLS